MVFVNDAHECAVERCRHAEAWEYTIELAGRPELHVLGFAPQDCRYGVTESLGVAGDAKLTSCRNFTDSGSTL